MKKQKDKMPLVHGANLTEKEADRSKYGKADSKEYLAEIRLKYDEWHQANMALIGPSSAVAETDQKVVERRVELFSQYKDFLDQQHYAEHFDSRSNLHSSVLEEFMYYLFKDLVTEFGEHALIGKSHTFKDIFFTPPSYGEMLKRPYAGIERKDHDFVIGVTIEASFHSAVPPKQDDSTGGKVVIITEEPEDYTEVTTTQNSETHLFDVPAIAIECKTYLDKNMLEGSSRSAEELKARNPNGLYMVVMEWIKLADAVNLRKYKVDQIYVLRRQKNTDRDKRYLTGYVKNPIDPDVVWHLYTTVRAYLTSDWLGGVENGIQRGWLI